MPLGVLIPAPATTIMFFTDSFCSSLAASATFRTIPLLLARPDRSRLQQK